MRSALVALLAFSILALWGCSTPEQPEETQGVVAAQLANPLRVCADYDEMNAALGFSMMQISGGGFEPQSYATIDGKIGQIIYTDAEGTKELVLRMSEGTGDISGVSGATYAMTEVGGVQVHMGTFKDIQVAWFEVGGADYALSATGLEPALFEGMVTDLAAGLAAAAAGA